MKQNKIGIDFGTTNSSIAVFDNGRPTIVRSEEGSAKSMKTAAFIFYDSIHRKIILKFGKDAEKAIRIEHGKDLSNNNRTLRMKYFHSIKMLLASTINEFSVGVKYSVTQIASDFLKNLTSGIESDIAVFSVPVVYHTDPSRHEMALAKFRSIIEMSGFKKESPFVLEPVAALCAYPDIQDGMILVCDIGGGTSDFALVEKSGQKMTVHRTWGNPIGGGNFDLQFARSILVPVLGGERIQRSMFDKFFTQDIAKLGVLRTPRLLNPIYQAAHAGKNVGAERFHNAIRQGSLGELLDKTEETKILLNDYDSILVPDFPLHPTADVLADYETFKSLFIAKSFETFLRNTAEEVGKIDTLFLTGGFSKSRLIKEMLSDLFFVKNTVFAETSAIGLGLLSVPEYLYL